MVCSKVDESLEGILERDLVDRFGPMLSGEALRTALGYSSQEAFRQAVSRKSVPIPVFTLPNRRGKFALAKDVASWLAQQRNQALQGQE